MARGTPAVVQAYTRRCVAYVQQGCVLQLRSVSQRIADGACVDVRRAVGGLAILDVIVVVELLACTYVDLAGRVLRRRRPAGFMLTCTQ